MQNKARNKGLFTDIEFVIGTPESNKTFHAHKLILACGSPVFEKMFYGALAESRRVIEMDDDPQAFGMLLNYLYSKPDNFLTIVNAWTCYVIGDKYLVSGFKEQAKAYILSSSINEETFWQIIENNIFPNTFFDDKVIDFIKENASKILKSPNFQPMTENVIVTILLMDQLNATEFEILLSVTKWAYGTSLFIASSESLLKFFKYIRFSTLTSNEYCEFISRFPDAIDAQNSLKIIMHLINKSTYALPEWCSKNLTMRNSGFLKKLKPSAIKVHKVYSIYEPQRLR